MNVYIILGLDDPVIDSALLLERLEGQKNVKVNLIKGSGHMSVYERSEICSELIQECL